MFLVIVDVQQSVEWKVSEQLTVLRIVAEKYTWYYKQTDVEKFYPTSVCYFNIKV